MLSSCRSSKRSSTTTTVGETEGSSSEGCNNEDNKTDSEEAKGNTEAVYSVVADVFLQGSGDDGGQGRTEEGPSGTSKG